MYIHIFMHLSNIWIIHLNWEQLFYHIGWSHMWFQIEGHQFTRSTRWIQITLPRSRTPQYFFQVYSLHSSRRWSTLFSFGSRRYCFPLCLVWKKSVSVWVEGEFSINVFFSIHFSRTCTFQKGMLERLVTVNDEHSIYRYRGEANSFCPIFSC